MGIVVDSLKEGRPAAVRLFVVAAFFLVWIAFFAILDKTGMWMWLLSLADYPARLV